MISKLNYSLEGSGDKTVVMLHGWGMNKNAFAEITKKFNTKAKCLIVDFYGFGASGMPEEYYDTYEYAYQIFLLLEKLNIKNIILVGHSFGGRVAIILSAVFNINVDGVLLAASAGLNRFDIKKKIKILVYKIKKFLVKYKIFSTKRLDNAGSRDYRRLSPIMKSCFVKIVNQDLAYLLNRINVKVELFWARDDKSTPIWICKKLNKNISNANVTIFSSGGHFVYLKRLNSFAVVLDRLLSNN